MDEREKKELRASLGRKELEKEEKCEKERINKRGRVVEEE